MAYIRCDNRTHSPVRCWPDAGGCDKSLTEQNEYWRGEGADALCDPCYEKLYGTEPDVTAWLEAQPTREEWLQTRLYDTVRPIVEKAGYTMPPIRVSCGWTGSGHDGCTLGVCYGKSGSKAGYYEIFVSPTLEDPVLVVSTMLHETAHAVQGCTEDHGYHYGEVCSRLRLTEVVDRSRGDTWPRHAWPSALLLGELAADAMQWEPYPHAALNPPPPPEGQGGGSGEGSGKGKGQGTESDTKQGTRLLKAQCPTCGYTVRVTMKWASRGLPACPVCYDCGGAPKLALEETKRPEGV